MKEPTADDQATDSGLLSRPPTPAARAGGYNERITWAGVAGVELAGEGEGPLVVGGQLRGVGEGDQVRWLVTLPGRVPATLAAELAMLEDGVLEARGVQPQP